MKIFRSGNAAAAAFVAHLGACLLFPVCAFAQNPATPPLLIPRPKQVAFAPDTDAFPLNSTVAVVYTDDAGQNAARLLCDDLREQFGLDITPQPADVRRMKNAVVIGTNLFAISTPDKPEGYAVRVTRAGVAVSGRDAAGVLWGVQTLRQLLDKNAGGPMVHPAQISDWPTLQIRAVHLFHGQNALPFHKKLMGRILSRYKMNALFLQAEQVRWNADPAVAPKWAGTPVQIKEEIAFAKTQGITVYPLLESYGHMEWLFSRDRNKAFAEDPETPYAVNITNPKAVAYLEKFNREADDLFGAPAFHAGLDEVTMRGRFPYHSKGRTFPDLFVQNARYWDDWAKKRGKTLWMWADMALHPSEVAPSFGTAPSAEDAAKIRAGLPKDIVMVDWQYSHRSSYPSLQKLHDAGFTKLVAATWNDELGIRDFSRAAADVGAIGAIQTTWAGYESSEAVLSTPNRNQFEIMVLAAEYFWNGGDAPVPDALPYKSAEVFARQWDKK